MSHNLRSSYIALRKASHSYKKGKISREYKTKNLSRQKIRSVTTTSDLKSTCKRIVVSERTAKRIRAAKRASKLTPSELTQRRDRCINEAIRQMQNTNQPGLCHNINAQGVRGWYIRCVANSKDFASLRGKKVPCAQIFREFIKLHKSASPDGRCQYKKEVLKNNGITDEQWKSVQRTSGKN